MITKLPKHEGGKAVRYTLFLLVATAMIVSMAGASLPALAQEKTDCAQYANNIQQKMSEDESKDVAKLLAEEPQAVSRQPLRDPEASAIRCSTIVLATLTSSSRGLSLML